MAEDVSLSRRWRRGIELLLAESRDKKTVYKMGGKKSSSQALNGLRIGLLGQMRLDVYGLREIERLDFPDDSNDELNRLLERLGFYGTMVHLVNLIDAMCRNQVRLRENLTEFVTAYRGNDKPRMQRLENNLDELRKKSDTIDKQDKTILDALFKPKGGAFGPYR